jgi:hypothetical protein
VCSTKRNFGACLFEEESVWHIWEKMGTFPPTCMKSNEILFATIVVVYY